MAKKENLLLDVDEVICFPGFLEAINAFLGTNYEIDDFTDYYMDEVAIPKEHFQEFNRFLKERNLYENASPLPYAVETIKKLADYYDIFLLSSCVNPFDIEGSGKNFKDKYDYLRKTLPFLNPEQVIFTSAKHLIQADSQIDDRLSNLKTNANIKILFPSYHNRKIKEDELKAQGVLRAGYDWRTGGLEVEEILLSESQGKQLIKK